MFYFRETHQYLYLIVLILFHYNIISPIYYIFSHYGDNITVDYLLKALKY